MGLIFFFFNLLKTPRVAVENNKFGNKMTWKADGHMDKGQGLTESLPNAAINKKINKKIIESCLM